MRLQREKLQTILTPLIAVALVVAAVGSSQAAFINLTPSNGVNSSTSVPLSDLVSGAVTGVTVGDKIFSGFNYSFLGDMPAPVDVQVLGFKDQNGNWGVSFHGTFIDLPGGGISDALIRFNVDISPAGLEEGYRISDAHLFMNGFGVGENSVLTVDESFLETNQHLNTFISTLNGGGVKSSDWVDIVPTQTTLHVTKDILAIAGANAVLPARTTAIDQSFSQTKIPEPAAALLSLCGVLGWGLSRRRERN